MYLIDTNVAIYLRDVEPMITTRVAGLGLPPAVSILTQVELEAGVHRDPVNAARRRVTLDALLDAMVILDLDADVIHAYGGILSARGFSRPLILDRLIAATAIVHGLTLVTVNAADFRDIPGLSLESWPPPDHKAPGQ